MKKIENYITKMEKSKFVQELRKGSPNYEKIAELANAKIIGRFDLSNAPISNPNTPFTLKSKFQSISNLDKNQLIIKGLKPISPEIVRNTLSKAIKEMFEAMENERLDIFPLRRLQSYSASIKKFKKHKSEINAIAIETKIANVIIPIDDIKNGRVILSKKPNKNIISHTIFYKKGEYLISPSQRVILTSMFPNLEKKRSVKKKA